MMKRTPIMKISSNIHSSSCHNSINNLNCHLHGVHTLHKDIQEKLLDRSWCMHRLLIRAEQLFLFYFIGRNQTTIDRKKKSLSTNKLIYTHHEIYKIGSVYSKINGEKTRYQLTS